MFSLTILGKYGAYNKLNTATSGYLLKFKDGNILVDIGSGVFSRLISLIEIEKLSLIILTHSHFDHISDLGILDYYLTLNNKNKIKVVIPKESNFNIELYKNFIFVKVEDNESLIYNGLEFKFFKMQHPCYCLGFKLKYKDKIFSYTGDTNYCENAEKLADKSDLFLADGLFLQREYSNLKPHMSALMCAEIGKRAKKTIITHLSPEKDDIEYFTEIKNYKNVYIAKELEEYEI